MSLVLPAPGEVGCPVCRFRGAPLEAKNGALSLFACAGCGLLVSVRPTGEEEPDPLAAVDESGPVGEPDGSVGESALEVGDGETGDGEAVAASVSDEAADAAFAEPAPEEAPKISLLVALGDAALDTSLTEALVAQADVSVSAHGGDLLTAWVRALHAGEDVAAIVCGLKTQALDGKNVAIMARGVEDGFAKETRTPILLCGSGPADAGLDAILSYVGDASYVDVADSAGVEAIVAALSL